MAHAKTAQMGLKIPSLKDGAIMITSVLNKRTTQNKVSN